MTPTHRAEAPGQRGSASVEMTVFVVPLMVLLLGFTVFCGRTASASIDVSSTAAAAARAAANAPTSAAALPAATAAVAATAAGTRWNCTPTVAATGAWLGGSVTVTIRCTIPLGDLGLPGIGLRRTLEGAATEPVDTYRAGA